MSLHFTLHINGHSIGKTLAIQRIKPKVKVPADRTICTYQVDLFVFESPQRKTRDSAYVTHRYGDGPIELVRKALNALHAEAET